MWNDIIIKQIMSVGACDQAICNMFSCYREYRRKQFIELSPDQRFLKYTQTKVFYFDVAASGPGLAESDTVCTINIPFIVCDNDNNNMQNALTSPSILVVMLGTKL